MDSSTRRASEDKRPKKNLAAPRQPAGQMLIINAIAKHTARNVSIKQKQSQAETYLRLPPNIARTDPFSPFIWREHARAISDFTGNRRRGSRGFQRVRRLVCVFFVSIAHHSTHSRISPETGPGLFGWSQRPFRPLPRDGGPTGEAESCPLPRNFWVFTFPPPLIKETK